MAGPKDDTLLNAAFSVHSNPGVYALLVGSGVSRGAGVPTGWDVVLDLVRRVAAVDRAEPGDSLEQWYASRFEEAPDYSKLLDRLAKSSADRMALLRAYFEPSEEDAQEGRKLPTAAHRAIARLVKLGSIRLVLTTNFDRLIETALAGEGIAPDVISTDDDLEGAMPVAHSKCTLVKLHGDYLDLRIKNTSDELAKYSKMSNTLLDRVLDEFGIIVCGWSAEWDTALRNAFRRCRSRRFTTYWLARGELGEHARRLVRRRGAEVVRITSADEALPRLVEMIESLREVERPHPMSTAVAVSTVKRYLSEPRFRISLEDIIRKELERVHAELSSPRFPIAVSGFDKAAFQKRMSEYEAIVERLAHMVATLSFYDDGSNSYQLMRCIERLTRFPTASGLIALSQFRLYPALLLAYSAGIGAVVRKRYENLKAVLVSPKNLGVRGSPEEPAIFMLNADTAFYGTAKWVPRENADKEYTAANNYILDTVWRFLREYIPDAEEYENAFDTFEYVLSLSYLDLKFEDPTTGHFPIGRFGWRGRYEWNEKPWAQFVQRGLEQGDDWEVLRAGFFRGLQSRATLVVESHLASLSQSTRGW